MRKLFTYCRKVFRYLRPYSALAVGAVVGSLAATGVGLLTPWPMKILVDSVLGNEPLTRLLTGLGAGGLNKSELLLAVVAGGFGLAALTSVVTVVTGYITTKLDPR
jgi:ABC-type multidrug transport system fused ATPase/permease subunit